MQSAPSGPGTSPVEVTNISPHGFWLFVGDRELFVPFQEFPWFRDASVREIHKRPASESSSSVLAGPRHRSRR